MNSWKWTKGEPYERSRRLKHVEKMENEEFSKEVETSAYTSALHHDENTWDILNQTAAFRNSNKREDLDLKIADRQMMQQRGANPFNPDSNYANDLTMYISQNGSTK